MYKSFNLENKPDNFLAGKTRFFSINWFNITQNKFIRDTICGYKLEMDEIPIQKSIPKPLTFNSEEQNKIDQEISRFLQCKIIEKANDTKEGEYLSNIFFRPKKDGKIRIILNLKNLNKTYLEKIHFKMETLQSAIDAMRPNCFFGSVDLAEAFYSIPIRYEDRKYFRFLHNNQKYQFTALIMGLTHSPRVFTKILKPVFANLRSKGHISSAYIDDSCLQGSTYSKCKENIKDTVTLMDSLGLTVQPEKSVFEPTQQIIFLGFLLCSITMTVRLPPDRCQEIINLCQTIIKEKRITIRKFSKLIGKLVATQQGVEFAPLFYKPLEKVKEHELKKHHGNYNSFMNIPAQIIPTIQWWIDNVSSSYKYISHGAPKLILYSDASCKGWGAYNETNNIRTGGNWSVAEQEAHINILELKACELCLHTFCKNSNNIHVRIYMDNTTSCAYINKFGGRTSELDTIARTIWSWCIERHIYLTAAHVPGKDNCEADAESRVVENNDTEWSLNSETFEAIYSTFPKLTVDLFASRLNNKLKKYASRRPDPNAFAIDAFSLTWNNDYYFIFPPFSLLPRILQKIEEDETSAVLIAPLWPTQSWWPSLLQLVVGQCFQLPTTAEILHLPHKPGHQHPMKKLRLGCFPLSGQPLRLKEFQSKQGISFSNHGGHLPKNNTIVTSQNGSLSVGKQLTLFNPRSMRS